jgi:hypothetical protein
MRKLTGWCLALAIVGFGASTLSAAPKAAKKSPEERFAKLDANGDKKLSLEEFLGKKKDDARTKAENRFGKLDKDSDKALSLEEFSATPKKKPK